MTGIPDAEKAKIAFRNFESQYTAAGSQHINPEDLFLAGWEAAEGPWREHLATQIMDELRAFLPEWDYPPHVVSAICLELKERLAR